MDLGNPGSRDSCGGVSVRTPESEKGRSRSEKRQLAPDRPVYCKRSPVHRGFPFHPVIAALLTMLCIAPAAPAQCEPVWSGLNGGADWEVRALATFDEDGAGPLAPALFAGGGFFDISGIASPLLTRWNGWEASPVGGGVVASDYGLASLMAVPQPVGMLPAGLYVGGEFDLVGGIPVNNIARWYWPEWHDVGGGVTRSGISIPYALDIAIFDEDGAGPKSPVMFVGGQFEFAGGVAAEGLARWDGREWSTVGGGLDTGVVGTYATVIAMAVYDDGRGPALYVGGSFAFAGGEEAWNIARWDGVNWEPLVSLDGTVESLCVFDEDGPGPGKPALFAGGQFSRAVGGEPQSLVRIGRWDGSEWTPVGGWTTAGVILAMEVWDPDQAGPAKESLYIGGAFHRLPDGTLTNKIARWDGAKWHTLGGGVTGFGAGTHVNSLGSFDEDGPGPNPGGLYVGGLFYRAGGVETHHIARWGCPLGPRPCYPDCDASGALDFLDFLCFQNAFAAAAPSADCDQSDALDFFDFLCFQNAFAAGCP